MIEAINIVLDGPPGGPEGGRFVEVELDDGKSIRIGDWGQKPDGYHYLRIAGLPGTPEPSLIECLRAIAKDCDRLERGFDPSDAPQLLRSIGAAARVALYAHDPETETPYPTETITAIDCPDCDGEGGKFVQSEWFECDPCDGAGKIKKDPDDG